MKNLKKFIAIFLTALTLLSVASLPVFAKTEGISEFYVTAFGDNKKTRIDWRRGSIDDKHYLFLPADCNLSNLKVNFTASDSVKVNGKSLKSGAYTDIFKNSGLYEMTCGGKTYKLSVLKSENIPSVYIQTESGTLDKIHSDKEYKETGNICIVENGKSSLNTNLEYIKGRGNATWDYKKKPYNIKFEVKTNLFGMGEAKKWALLANHVDESLIRNQTAFALAEKIDIPYTSSCQHVDLYINNEYQGNYLVCESIEVGDTRVDITDLDKLNEEANKNKNLKDFTKKGSRSGFNKSTRMWVDIPNDPDDISGGYLLEFELSDRYSSETSGFVTAQGQNVVVKSPEYASENQINYIADLYQELEDAVYSEDGYNELGKHYSEYIDLESFMKMYLFQEYLENLDSAITSFFLIKDAGSDKFVAGPVWDYDQAIGEPFARFGLNTKTSDQWWASIIYYEYGPGGNLPTFFNKLCEKEGFINQVSKYWRDEFSPKLDDEWFESIKGFYTELEASALMNAIRCNVYKNSEIERNETRYVEDSEAVITFLKERKAFLDKGFSEKSARLYYKANGGSGVMFCEEALEIGDTVILKNCSFKNNSANGFKGWNTKADGSGTSYNEGDEITIDSSRIELYAQWDIEEETTSSETVEAETVEKKTFWSSIADFFSNIFESIKNFFTGK